MADTRNALRWRVANRVALRRTLAAVRAKFTALTRYNEAAALAFRDEYYAGELRLALRRLSGLSIDELTQKARAK